MSSAVEQSGSTERAHRRQHSSDGEGSVGNKRAAVGVVKVSKDGLFVNNFIATKNVAIQQDTGRKMSLNLSIDRQYLKKISTEQQEKKKTILKKHRSVQRKEIAVDDQDPLDFALRDVLESLVNLIRPTEVVRFLTTLRAAKINDTELCSTLIKPPVLDADGEVISEGLSDLFVAIITNNGNGVEETAVLVLKQEALSPSITKEVRRTTFTTSGEAKEKKPELPLAELEFDRPASDEDSDTQPQRFKTTSLQLSPDTPADIMFAASKLHRAKTAKPSRNRSKSRKKGKARKYNMRRRTDERSQKQPTEEVAKLHVLGLVQVLNDMRIRLNGEGQVKVVTNGLSVDLDTVSIRSMWGFVMGLQRARHFARANNLYNTRESHAWVSMYVDDNTSVANFSARNSLSATFLEEDDERNLDGIGVGDKESDEPKLQGIEELVSDTLKDSDDNGVEEYFGDTEVTLPKRSDLVVAIKKILVKFNIDEISMKDVYEGLEEMYGKDIVGERGFSKSLIDKLTMRAVGQVDPPSQIIEGLYLGTEYNASNKQELDELNVKLIVNVTEEVENFFPEFFRYHVISLKDRPTSELKPHFSDAIKAIDAALNKGEGVLVHCQRGVSRSATIVIAYLMKYKNMPRQEALRFAKAQRPIVRPNEGFEEQLYQFEEELAGDQI